jgi:hypothetical protein
MSTARKTRAPKTEPAIAPVLDVDGVAGTALGEELELELGLEVDPEEGAMVEDGDWEFMQDASPDKPTVESMLPPVWPKASTIKNTISVPL